MTKLRQRTPFSTSRFYNNSAHSIDIPLRYNFAVLLLRTGKFDDTRVLLFRKCPVRSPSDCCLFPRGIANILYLSHGCCVKSNLSISGGSPKNMSYCKKCRLQGGTSLCVVLRIKTISLSRRMQGLLKREGKCSGTR
jgi:hypothetical protein